MKNYRLYIAIIISLLIHILILRLLDWEPAKTPEDKPMSVQIIEPPEDKKENAPEVKPDILSDKDIARQKESEKGEDTYSSRLAEPKPKQRIQPVPKPEVKVAPESKPKPKPQPKPEPQPESQVKSKPEQQPDTEPELDVAETENKNETEEKPPEENVKQKDTTESKTQLSKRQLENIFNPDDIIREYAFREKKQEEGEDSVNFNAMKNKYASYFYKFRRNLYQVWTYPRNSIINNEQGRVRIQFSIEKDGTVTNTKVVSSSGYPDLDRAAVDALKNMGKVPFGDSFDLERLNVDGYFRYIIGDKYIY